MAQGANSLAAGDSLDEMRSIIDRDIARLEESIRALKSRRNELSPMSRLPAEILCHIFSLIEDDIFSSSRSPKFWTYFSQVSQHWRSTALNAPELWTEIPVSLPRRWVQERLIRSKMAKLTIRSGSSFKFDTSNPKAIETVRSCLYEMNRVEELKLTANANFLVEIFRDLPKSAPQLHTLCIESTVTFKFSIHVDFLHDAERLQRAELYNCKISWDSWLLTGLTCLNLENCLEANSSIIQFLHALRRMPAITDLRLIDSIPDDSEGPTTYPVVDLPCLRILHISSGVGALTTFLRHITIPNSAILNLTCRENQSTHIDFSNFLSVLATKFLSFLDIRGLSLRVLDGFKNHGLKFHLWTTANIPFQLQLFLTWPLPHPHNYVKALTSAFNVMSLSFLTELYISTLNYIDPQTWVKTFGKLPLLNWVRVQDSALYSFLHALVYKTMAAEKSKEAYRDVSFPKLRHIDLKGTDFVGTGTRSISVDMLLDCLMERRERKAEVRVLNLKDCYYISSHEVERLKEVVVEVIWDGIEQEFSEEEFSEEDIDYDSDGISVDFDF